jgi:hypothetical protein
MGQKSEQLMIIIIIIGFSLVDHWLLGVIIGAPLRVDLLTRIKKVQLWFG